MNALPIIRLLLLSSGFCVAQLAPLTVSAQAGADRERASILLGAFVTDRDTSTRLDSDAGPGTDLDLEDDLGLESSTSVVRLGGYFWLGSRHRIDAAYFDLSRNAAVPIEETIDFGDETFEINTVVATESDVSIIKADYTFAVVARDRGFLGVTGGLYILETTLSLSQATLERAESEDLTAPLPLFGLRGDFALGDHITLRGAMQWFGFESGDVDGHLTDFYFGADYGFGERMAVEEGFNGRLDWGYDGVLLYFKYDFQSRT
jgi:hypothetical protein